MKKQSGEWHCEDDECSETFDTWGEAARHERDAHGIRANGR